MGSFRKRSQFWLVAERNKDLLGNLVDHGRQRGIQGDGHSGPHAVRVDLDGRVYLSCIPEPAHFRVLGTQVLGSYFIGR